MSDRYPALALLEFDSVAAGIVAGDAMVKRAPLGDLVAGMLSDRAQQKMIFYYVPYAMGKLRQYAEGGSVAWNRDVDAWVGWTTVPLLYAIAFLPPAFLIFRKRNITA